MLSITQLHVRYWQHQKMHVDCHVFSESIEEASEKFGFHKVSLMRNFCKKVGIQLLLREYQVDNRVKAAFSEEDVLNLFPVIKHLHPKVIMHLMFAVVNNFYLVYCFKKLFLARC
jgi:hypothetical protein